LNGLLSQPQAVAGRGACDYDDMPEDLDAFRNELARRIRVFFGSRAAAADDEAEPNGA
jgi:hypothetical protein